MLKRIKTYFKIRRELIKLNKSYYNLATTEKAILYCLDATKPTEEFRINYFRNLYNEVTEMMEKLEKQIKFTKMQLDDSVFWY